MTRVAVLASFNMDLVMRTQGLPVPGETVQGDFAMFLGGKGFNQAVAARRLGAEVAVVGRVGDDEFGRAFLAALDRAGIAHDAVSIDGETGTGVASIVVDADGENSIIQAPRANRNVSEGDIDRFARSGRFNVALLNLETSLAGALAFSRRARDAGARVVCNPAPAAPVPGELLALADVLVPNAREVTALSRLPARTVEEALVAAQRLRDDTGPDVVVTLGSLGAVYAGASGSGHIAPPPVDAIDSVGAGDAFCAALAVRLAEGASLADAVRFANAAGALAATVAGAEPSMPQRAAVEKLVATPPR